jgi:catechol 2,3-dioxygenase-like lactoylglutathione lyase family enzyme
MEMSASIKGLDHWAIVTADEKKCTAFYQGILGLKIGPRPQLTFKGVWFYSGDIPIVHVISDREFQAGQTGAFESYRFCQGRLAHRDGAEAPR